MTGVQNDTTKMYSNDRRLYSGMIGKDVYKNNNDYALFQVADQNQNDTISNLEIYKYDGYTTNINGFELNPESNIDDIPPSVRSAYRDIDTNGDSKVSKKEIEEYNNYLALKENNNKKKNELNEAQAIYNDKKHMSIVGGAIGGFLGGIVSANMASSIANTAYSNLFYKDVWQKNITPFEKKIMNALKTHWTETKEGPCMKGPSEITIDHFETGPLKKAMAWGGGILAAGLIGYGVYKLISKIIKTNEAKNDVEKLNNEIIQNDMTINQLNKIYEHC